MWSLAVGCPPRLALSALASTGRYCILKPNAAKRKDLPARHPRGFSDFPQLLPEMDLMESPPRGGRNRRELTRYMTNRTVARTVARILCDKTKMTSPILLECNPGPGILTQELLETGTNVIALESEKHFIPHLKSVEKALDGKLQVFHCDFFKMDPRDQDVFKPPIMCAHTLFEGLGIEAVPWSGGVPLSVFGILPVRNERKALWKLIFDLYSYTSIYSYGRVQLYLYVSEKEYKKLEANPKKQELYHVLSVLWQVACDMKVLHKTSCSSFDVFNENKCVQIPKQKELLDPLKQDLYLVQMTPRKDLFTDQLTPMNFQVFFHMVKHCFAKRSATVSHHLRSLSTVDSVPVLRQAKRHPEEKVTDMYPQDFKHLFEIVECSGSYSHKWLFDDTMDDIMVPWK